MHNHSNGVMEDTGEVLMEEDPGGGVNNRKRRPSLDDPASDAKKCIRADASEQVKTSGATQEGASDVIVSDNLAARDNTSLNVSDMDSDTQPSEVFNELKQANFWAYMILRLHQSTPKLK